MNLRVIVAVNSGVVLAIGLALLVPLVLSLLYPDGSWRSFLFPAVGMIAAGARRVSCSPPPRAALRGTCRTGTCTSR